MATDLTAAPSGATVPEGRPRRRRPRRAIVAAVILVVAAIVAAGVAAGRSDGPPGAVSAEGRAPAFDLPRLGAAGRVRLADFAGRPLVVNFWASWCVPCRKEMPALQAAARRLEGRVAFVGVNHQDGRAPAAAFERVVGVSYPSGYDPDGAVARDFAVVGLPTTVLVDARGDIVARRLGEVTEDELLDLVAEALGVDADGSTP